MNTGSPPIVGISSTASHVGKTMVSLGFMERFCQEGLEVQPFKVGPDFIDPEFHRTICERPSRNLDPFFSDPDDLHRIVDRSLSGVDLGIVEGVMGLFDGREEEPFSGSTAQVFKTLNIPFYLVVDGQQRSHSVAAQVHGFLQLQDNLNCRGVIINRVSSPRHETMVQQALATLDDCPNYVCIPRMDDLDLPERHLGLHTNRKSTKIESFRGTLRKEVVPKLSRFTVPNVPAGRSTFTSVKDISATESSETQITIGIVRDEAFHFYYERNLDELRRRDARLQSISLFDQKRFDEIDGMYVGGGYPESFAEHWKNNEDGKEALLRRIKDGLPVWAECGGFMILGEEIQTTSGESIPGIGWFPLRFRMTDSIQSLAYTKGIVTESGLWGNPGDEIVGHRFHYSRIVEGKDIKSGIRIERGSGGKNDVVGVSRHNVYGSYIHPYFPACDGFPESFIQRCIEFSEGKKVHEKRVL
ncbi:MAG: cobyrinate a,c-diamide synthase [bacterium]